MAEMFGLLCQCEFDAVMRQPLRIGPVPPVPPLEATPVEQQGNVTKKVTFEDANNPRGRPPEDGATAALWLNDGSRSLRSCRRPKQVS